MLQNRYRRTTVRRDEEPEVEPKKVDTSSYTSRRTTPAEDESRMTIAERLRRKNQELISNSSDRSSSDRSSSLTDRYTSIRDRDRDNNNSTSSYNRDSSTTSSYTRPSSTSSFRDRNTSDSNTSSNDTSTRGRGSTSSDAGSSDAKEIQRKLEAARKDLADYKQKYDSMIKEKEKIQEQMDKAKADVEKITEMKNDNLRLKDENGALIRVISKLSRTPSTPAS